MPETYNDDLWREVEQEDSWSSSDSDLYLESSNDTEIITVPAEHVPHVQSEVEQAFLQERFMRAFRLVMADINRETQDGGAPDSVTVQYADDTVDTVQTQDTDTAPDTDTADTVSPADTDKDQDTDITQTQDSLDT